MEKKELVVLWLDNHRDPAVWFDKKLTSNTHRWTLAFFDEKVYPYYSPRFVWVKQMGEFQEYLRTHDMPGLICFDFDLYRVKGDDEPNGLEAEHWLVDFCKEKGVELPMCWVQAGNRHGAPLLRKFLGIPEPEV